MSHPSRAHRLTMRYRSLEGWAVAQVYDFEVQSNGGTVAAIRSVEVREPEVVLLQIAELAECSFALGSSILVTDQRGETVMHLGLETAGFSASQRRQRAPGARSQPPLQKSPARRSTSQMPALRLPARPRLKWESKEAEYSRPAVSSRAPTLGVHLTAAARSVMPCVRCGIYKLMKRRKVPPAGAELGRLPSHFGLHLSSAPPKEPDGPTPSNEQISIVPVQRFNLIIVRLLPVGVLMSQ
jgi:hypothetical protein